MITEYFTFTGHGGKQLPAVLWRPEGYTNAVLQLTHGMTEHMGCYESLAAYLCPLGVAVAGFDLRGHGKNEGDRKVATFGEGGWDASIQDMKCFFDLLQNRFPQARLYLHGFSLGSFLLREYLGQYSQSVSGAIIMGTGHQPGWLLRGMMAIVRRQIKKEGFNGYSPLVRMMSFGFYNLKFKNPRTEKDWLCSDEKQLADFMADPLSRENFSAGLFCQMLGAMERQGNDNAFDNWNKDIPILLLYGEMDPVGDFGKGVEAFHDRMKKAGIRNITSHGFPGARHQILREEACGAAENARQIIADWLMG